MLSDYLKKKNISKYSISKKANIPYSTISDLCNGKVEIDNCKVNMVMKLAKALNITFEQLYEFCKNKDSIVKVEGYETTGKIVVKNKNYYVEYLDNGVTNYIYLFKVNTTNNKYIKEAAEWMLEDRLIEREIEKLSNIQSIKNKWLFN